MSQNRFDETASLRIRGEPSELSSVRQHVEEQARAVGFSDAETGKIALAVDEALANVIRHGYGGPCDRPIDITIEQVQWAQEVAIAITIRDFGQQVDPADIAGRMLEDVRPGGLGVHIIHAVMDEVTYTPAQGGGMQLVMKKKLP
ncbi:MAG: ATP-binding protein [Phycisphaerae bacterium]